MNDLEFQYKRILDYLIHRGEEKKDRTGTGTLSTFGWQIRHQMSDGFPLLTTKKMAWKSIVVELLACEDGVAQCFIKNRADYEKKLLESIDNFYKYFNNKSKTNSNT